MLLHLNSAARPKSDWTLAQESRIGNLDPGLRVNFPSTFETPPFSSF
jgi:hypothetical protein